MNVRNLTTGFIFLGALVVAVPALAYEAAKSPTTPSNTTTETVTTSTPTTPTTATTTSTTTTTTAATSHSSKSSKKMHAAAKATTTPVVRTAWVDADGLKKHLSEHITYPATKEQLVEACNKLSDIPTADKTAFNTKLPTGTYASAQAVLDALNK